MLGQPVYFLTPDVVGVHLTGSLKEGVYCDRLSRSPSRSSCARRRSLGNSSSSSARALPRCRWLIGADDREHGARIRRDHGLLPDRRRMHELPSARPAATRNSSRRTRLITRPRGFGVFRRRVRSTTRKSSNSISARCRPKCRRTPSVRQDRIELTKLKNEFTTSFSKPVCGKWLRQKKPMTLSAASASAPRKSRSLLAGGSQEPVSAAKSKAQNTNPQTELEMANNRPTPDTVLQVKSEYAARHQSATAACSSPRDHELHQYLQSVGHARPPVFLRRRPSRKGLKPNSVVKASLAPGSRVVTDYLKQDRSHALPRPARLPDGRLRLHDLHR